MSFWYRLDFSRYQLLETCKDRERWVLCYWWTQAIKRRYFSRVEESEVSKRDY